MGNQLVTNTGGKSNTSDKSHKMHLSEPWFTLISLGLKKVEGRLNKGKFKELEEGDIIEWYNDDFNHRSCLTKISKINTYATFKEYLHKEGLQNCLTGISNMDTGLSVYYKYYTKEDEKKFGIVAIQLVTV
jgi:ASC-1-like (ASCH) protein